MIRINKCINSEKQENPVRIPRNPLIPIQVKIILQLRLFQIINSQYPSYIYSLPSLPLKIISEEAYLFCHIPSEHGSRNGAAPAAGILDPESVRPSDKCTSPPSLRRARSPYGCLLPPPDQPPRTTFYALCAKGDAARRARFKEIAQFGLWIL